LTPSSAKRLANKLIRAAGARRGQFLRSFLHEVRRLARE